MFHDVAAVYVGCSVDEYISSISQGENQSVYYRGLGLQNSREVRFVTTINSVDIDSKGSLSLVAHAIQKIEATIEEEVKKSPSKNVKPRKASKKKSSVELELSEHQEKGKRKIFRKKFEDCVDVSSGDDDDTLENFISKSKRKRSSMRVKVKKEKD